MYRTSQRKNRWKMLLKLFTYFHSIASNQALRLSRTNFQMSSKLDQILNRGFEKSHAVAAVELLGEDYPIDTIIQYLKTTNAPCVLMHSSSNLIDLTEGEENSQDKVTDSSTLHPSSEVPRSLITTVSSTDMVWSVQNDNLNGPSKNNRLKVLSYNIWFENVMLEERLIGISNIIQKESPDVIFLQEVRHDTHNFLRSQPWWSEYSSSRPPKDEQYFVVLLTKLPSEKFQTLTFRSSNMGRRLEIVTVPKYKLIFATTHLESPTPPIFNEVERRRQLQQSFRWLSEESIKDISKGHPGYDIILGGDLNWDESRGGKQPDDGPIPFPDDTWQDAWLTIYPPIKTDETVASETTEGYHTPVKGRLRKRKPEDSDRLGYTYDATQNPMLKGYWKGRLDRLLCRLSAPRSGYTIMNARLVGKDPLPGVTYTRTTRNPITGEAKNYPDLPVLPSDHYGLVVEFIRKSS